MNIFSKLSNWYFSRNALPYWCVLFLDCLIVFLSSFLSIYAEVGAMAMVLHFWPIIAHCLLFSGIFAIFFYCFHTYHGVIRYTSLSDLQRIALSTACGTLLSMAVSFVDVVYFNPSYISEIRHCGLIGAILLLVFSTMSIWLVRITVKTLFESFRIEAARPVAIYGTKAGGVAIANSLFGHKDKSFRLNCFISDADDMKGSYLMGKLVLENTPDIGRVLRQRKVSVILISPLKTELFINNQEMVDSVTNAGIKIMMMPHEMEWDGKSDLGMSQLREVDIEDLLPRDKIEVDMKAIGNLLRDKCILITGAAGSIGSEMVRQVAQFHPAEMILIDQAETPMHDIRMFMAREYAFIKCETIVSSIANQKHMEKIFDEHRPEYVFHAAAYKHVPMMEDNPAIAVQNNVYGTRVIADLAVKYGTRKFVMISTDKAVNPTNVMGCSKRICEIYCQALNKAIAEGEYHSSFQGSSGRPCTQFVTTRFGNVLGSNGSVIPIFKEQIRKGGPLTVTHPDIIRYFMLIPEACRLVLEAGTMGKGGEIFVFDMGKPVRIVDLANRMIQLSGAQNIQIKFTGLRNGEKLYEEVLSDKENTKPTPHPKIMVAQVREYDYATAVRNEEELLQLSYSHDDMSIVKKMKEIVPEFKSKVSKYEILDK